MSVIRWVKWFFWDSRRCEHEEHREWIYVNCGMNKAMYCKKCGKLLTFI